MRDGDHVLSPLGRVAVTRIIKCETVHILLLVDGEEQDGRDIYEERFQPILIPDVRNNRRPGCAGRTLFADGRVIDSVWAVNSPHEMSVYGMPDSMVI